MNEIETEPAPEALRRLVYLGTGCCSSEAHMEVVVEVSSDRSATATCDGVVFTGNSDQINDQVAIAMGRKLGVPPESISLDVYQSFEGGPTHVTYGWRYVVPPTWDEILTEMEAKYARSAA